MESVIAASQNVCSVVPGFQNSLLISGESAL